MKHMNNRKKLLAQIMRFAAVGGTAFLIDIGFLKLFTDGFGIYYLLSAVFSFILSTLYNYWASVHWVFDVDQTKSKARNFTLFFALSAVGLLINEIMMKLFTDGFGMYYMFSKIAATAVVTVYNFVTRKLFLEKHVC